MLTWPAVLCADESGLKRIPRIVLNQKCWKCEERRSSVRKYPPVARGELRHQFKGCFPCWCTSEEGLDLNCGFERDSQFMYVPPTLSPFKSMWLELFNWMGKIPRMKKVDSQTGRETGQRL